MAKGHSYQPETCIAEGVLKTYERHLTDAA
jgi:hypothetical protein